MDIRGYENYTIDLDGNVWGKKRKKYLKQTMGKYGYLYITLPIKSGKYKTQRIHRLMGLTYLPNFYNKPCIDHKNRNKSDNRLFNLRWVTRCENSQNRGFNSNNTSGYKYITFDKNIKNGFIIRIKRNNKVVVERLFSYKKWNLEQIVQIRDFYCLLYDINLS